LSSKCVPNWKVGNEEGPHLYLRLPSICSSCASSPDGTIITKNASAA
jgi:hypothetical protein